MNRHNLAKQVGKDKQNSDYVTGDVVVYISVGNNELHEIYKVHSNTCVSIKPLKGSLLLQRVTSAALLRHATVTEIQAGKRSLNTDLVILDMGDDHDIENHISKNCRVISNDFSKFLSRALNAQKEMT